MLSRANAGWQSSSCPYDHKGRAGETLIPCPASSPRGLGRSLSTKLQPRAEPGRKGSGHAGEGSSWAASPGKGTELGRGKQESLLGTSCMLGSGTRGAGLDPSVWWCTPWLPHVPLGSEAGAAKAVGTSPLRVLVCRVPMGRQSPAVPRWRQLLRAGCWWLLSLSGMMLRGLRWLWRLAWVGTARPLPQEPSFTSLCWLQTWRVPRAWACCQGSLCGWHWGLWFGAAEAAWLGRQHGWGALGCSHRRVGSRPMVLHGSAH